MFGHVLRRAGSMLVVATLAASAIVVAADPCFACSCVGRSAGEILRDSDVAFVGTVVGERGLSDTATIQVFEVEAAYKGQVTETMEIVMPIGPNGASSCGVMYSRGQRVAIAAYRAESGYLTADVCSMLSPADMERAAGPGVPPSPDPVTASPEPAVGGTGLILPSWAVAALGAVGGIALISIAMWATERRARRRVRLAGPEAADEAPEAPPG